MDWSKSGCQVYSTVVGGANDGWHRKTGEAGLYVDVICALWNGRTQLSLTNRRSKAPMYITDRSIWTKRRFLGAKVSCQQWEQDSESTGRLKWVSFRRRPTVQCTLRFSCQFGRTLYIIFLRGPFGGGVERKYKFVNDERRRRRRSPSLSFAGHIFVDFLLRNVVNLFRNNGYRQTKFM